jgi:hypothetical protein
MECTIQWLPASGMAFLAETGSGHLLTMDGAPDGGGRNLAPRPLETFLAGAGDVKPDAILFNGGFFIPEILRQRVADIDGDGVAHIDSK